MFSNHRDADVFQIELVVNGYFDGYLNADPETLSNSFHPESRLLSSDEGTLDITELKDWLLNLHERKAKGDIRQAKVEVLGIDVCEKAAVAKVKLIFPKFAFIDYLSLLQIAGKWIIVNKIYTTEKFESET